MNANVGHHHTFLSILMYLNILLIAVLKHSYQTDIACIDKN